MTTSFNYNEASALRERRAKAHAHMSSMLQKEQTNETRSQLQRVVADIDSMTAQINKIEKPGTYTPEVNYTSDAEIRQRAAFEKYVRGGNDALTTEQRSLLKRETRDLTEGGAQGAHIGSYSNLGYFVPTGFVSMVEDAKKFFCVFDDIAQIMKTATGNALPWPVSNDVDNKATVIDEANQVTELDVESVNHVIFQAYKLKSGLIKVSQELLDDSSIDIQSWLAQRFAERFGRGEQAYFTTGTGTDQPHGILTEIAASGATPVTALGSAANDGSSADGTNSIGYQDLVNLEHSVDPAYRPGASYMMNDKTLAKIKLILDKFGRPLWAPGIAVGAPDTLNGYRLFVNQEMPLVAPGNTTMVFGDFSKFVVRRVGSMSVRRLVERYAEFDEVAFLGFERVDSRLLDAGTHPLNVVIQHT